MDDMMITEHETVSREAWVEARKALLAQEKALTRARDALAAQRRALPWVRIDTDYVFETEAGPRRLAELFEGRTQLLVYHFMFAPDWEEGCASCSFLADHIDGALPHLAARDVTLTAVSRAPLEKLLGYRARMGWRFPWVSAGDGPFAYDFGVAFTAAELASGSIAYNYGRYAFPVHDAHGMSAFIRGANGAVFHTYSSYGRGVEALVGTYNWLDLAPRGRDEDELPWTMAWVRRHDRYGGEVERRCHAAG